MTILSELLTIIKEKDIKDIENFVHENANKINYEQYNLAIKFTVENQLINKLKTILSLSSKYYGLTEIYIETLNVCSKLKNKEMFELLINNKQLEFSFSSYQLIFIASREGYLELIKLLIKNREIFNVNYLQESFEVAFMRQHFEIAKFFITEDLTKKYIDTKATLIDCIEKEYISFFHFLLKNKTAPNFFSNQPIITAFNFKKYYIVDTLWKYQEVKDTLDKNSDVYKYLIQKEIKDKLEGF